MVERQVRENGLGNRKVNPGGNTDELEIFIRHQLCAWQPGGKTGWTDLLFVTGIQQCRTEVGAPIVSRLKKFSRANAETQASAADIQQLVLRHKSVRLQEIHLKAADLVPHAANHVAMRTAFDGSLDGLLIVIV